ncbi:MAG: ribosomal-protein-alanine N-acetyltransferase [Actinomycetales bacterium mxb001]|nr:MAG: ribosomal-protein-alanine N-acetyltransferase [Actinomycetales bacterium mxb001]
MSINVRPMRWWDIESVVAIEEPVFESTAWSAGQFWGELARDDRAYVVMDDDEGVVAYAGLLVRPPTADVQTIAVAPRARRRGLATTMLRHLLKVADAADCREIMLEVRADSAGAIALYERHGFEVIARRTSYYGPGLDALIMRHKRGNA